MPLGVARRSAKIFWCNRQISNLPDLGCFAKKFIKFACSSSFNSLSSTSRNPCTSNVFSSSRVCSGAGCAPCVRRVQRAGCAENRRRRLQLRGLAWAGVSACCASVCRPFSLAYLERGASVSIRERMRVIDTDARPTPTSR